MLGLNAPPPAKIGGASSASEKARTDKGSKSPICTLTAHVDLLNFAVLGLVAVVVLDNSLCGDARDSGNDVVGAHALGETLLDELVSVAVAKHFTTGGLGRVEAEVVAPEKKKKK